MNQQNDSQRQSQSSGQQSQSQSADHSGAARPDPNGGMHPGEDRDDYGAPGSDSGRVGDTQFEQERREPGQVDEGDRGTDSGAPAGYGDRGQGGEAPGQYEQSERDEQDSQGRFAPDSEGARQAEQSEFGSRRASDDSDPDFGQE
ncbi:hypothetical protein A6F68_00688 [Tsuneonella dongtanensis]|uniref:Uncharacterized protein n=1 Tax=Tsuneonella dongtanensis TaxID=692370 RepID=A0A1B2AAM7_9SPHN|nr:hypothetical protein [Tsuneonella dongtanensis]ANY19217.1 hypothetical protein A6F68_00688 [Tsuneonella dongtanensis]